MIGPTKDTFIQPLSIKEVLDELETFKNYYCRTFETAFEKRTCFANNYFNAGLKALQENISLQFVLNKY